MKCAHSRQYKFEKELSAANKNISSSSSRKIKAVMKIYSAWVLYRQNGRCYAQWYQYGYSYAGGGIYSKELTQWKINDNSMYAEARTPQGNENLYSGSNFEFDGKVIK